MKEELKPGIIKGLEAIAELGYTIKGNNNHTTLLVFKDCFKEFARTIRKYPDFEHGRIQKETERMMRNHIELMKSEIKQMENTHGN
jgi:hypothetical protein